MVNEKRDVILTKYDKAYNEFAVLSGSAQLFLTENKSAKEKLDRATEHLGFISELAEEGDIAKPPGEQPIVKKLPDYVIVPRHSPKVPMTKLYESVTYMETVSQEILDFIPLEAKKTETELTRNWALDSASFAPSENSMINLGLENLKDEMEQSIKPGEASSEISGYYRTMMDLNFGSRNLNSIMTACSEVSKQQDNQQVPDPIHVKASSNFLRVFENTISRIYHRIKTFAKDVASFIIDPIRKLGTIINEAVTKIIPEKLAEALTELSARFLDFVGTLLEKMFGFLSKFAPLATKIGYTLSEVEILLPKVSIKDVTIFTGIVIPLPWIDPPNITLKIKANAKTTEDKA